MQMWQGEALSDSDASTGYTAAMRALGENNPQIIKHRKSNVEISTEVNGGICFDSEKIILY